MNLREILESSAKNVGMSVLIGPVSYDERGVCTTAGWWNPWVNDAEAWALSAQVALRQSLYPRAVNQANGWTNYVEERPELRRAEKALEAIEAEARAAIATQESDK
jgi:hypothetical protein